MGVEDDTKVFDLLFNWDVYVVNVKRRLDSVAIMPEKILKLI